MTAPGKDDLIIIIGGGGTFGASTALHLARRGYRNILALDTHPPPSEISAGYDVNKIVRTEYKNPFHTQLAKEAIQAWRDDPVFAPHFHQTGWVIACDADQRDTRAAEQLIFAPHRRMQADPYFAGQLEVLDDGTAIKRRVPALQWLGSHVDDWMGMWNGVNGWAMAKDAIASAAEEAQRLGVRYRTGQRGEVALLQPRQGATYLRTRSGEEYTCSHVVLATGAWSPGLVDLSRQCDSKCWTVGHIQLTPEEAAELKDMPVVDHADLGFFFEPTSTGKIKLCNEFPGYRNTVPTSWGSLSVPAQTKWAVPDEAMTAMRALVAKIMPRLQDRPIEDTLICWCTDSLDAHWLVCPHPEYGTSLLLATGDSGHSFKFLPTVGFHIADALEGKLDHERESRWRWRPNTVPVDPSRPDGDIKELRDLPGWPERRTPKSSL